MMTIEVLGVTQEGRCETCGLFTDFNDLSHKAGSDDLFCFCSVCYARHDFVIKRASQSPRFLEEYPISINEIDEEACETS